VHPISYFQSVVLGLLQGVSTVPISSLATQSSSEPFRLEHPPEGPYFLTFLVALHLATAIVLLGFFWQDGCAS